MPYEPLFDGDQPPIDRDTLIWRYMDFSKLAALLSSKTLYFCQLPLLGDPFEGSLVKVAKENVLHWVEYVAREHPTEARTEEEIRNQILSSRAYSYASCWHANDRESAAMWDLYARNGFGIAVQSTMGRLIDAAANVPEKVWIGSIIYHDYDTAQPAQNSLWTPMFQKRKSFEHEHEVRALVMDWERVNTMRLTYSYEPNPVPGRNMPFDLNVLIANLYVSPNTPSWFRETVTKVVDAIGWGHLPILQSHLEATPLFVKPRRT